MCQNNFELATITMQMVFKKIRFLFLWFLCFSKAHALTINAPASDQFLLGGTQQIYTQPDDNVIVLAQRYDVGYNMIQNANPQLDLNRGFLPNTPVLISTRTILPDAPREGIVVNLPEMRLYYFDGKGHISLYPIGIGQIGKTIPIRKTHVWQKKMNPIWTPTVSELKFNEAKGIHLPKHMPPGPDNPLGKYGIYLGIPTFLIHSTIFPESIGRRGSFGCIRVLEKDVQVLFSEVQPRLPVVIVNQPIKFAKENQRLYLEMHPPLEEVDRSKMNLPELAKQSLVLTQGETWLMDWQGISYVNREKDGMPHEIGIQLPADRR